MNNISISSIPIETCVVKYMEEVKKFPVLSQEEELGLIKSWLNDSDIRAAHKLVTSHLRLVVKIACKFRSYGLPLMDMISEGNIGLMKAVKKFNPEKGNRLSTYAMWWIKACIQEYIVKSWSMVKISSGILQKKLFSNIESLKKKISDKNSKEKDVSDNVLESSYNVVSLNQKLNIEDESELIDVISDKSQDQESILTDRQEHSLKLNSLRKAISKLSAREQDIIQQRRLSENTVTLEVLSDKYKVSSERIRQIEEAAINKIKSFVSLNQHA